MVKFKKEFTQMTINKIIKKKLLSFPLALYNKDQIFTFLNEKELLSFMDYQPDIKLKPLKFHYCASCGEKIYELIPKTNMWNGGIVGNIDAGYGSKFDLESFTIAICDKCIERKSKLKKKSV